MVRFQFDGEKEIHIGWFTYQQYLNLKELPITKVCEIVPDANNVLSDKEIELINKKMRRVSSKGHTKILSQN